MSPQEELIKMWLDRAKVDFRGAEVDLSVDPPIIEDVCFHSQQAIEKILKAFLTYHEIEFEKIHDLEYLIRLCKGCDESFEILREPVKPLSKYAVQFRYPYAGPVPTLTEARKTLELARTVWQFVLPKLPKESMPGL